MCGIAGCVNWERDISLQADTIRSMGSALACRGPDDEGLWLSQRCGFAHRRLVVVDPAGGAQPMLRHRPTGGACVIVYNGELYNTPDIRDDLRAKGWTFQGHSDTEVLLKAYIEWGPPCVERFNGIFAFAIWDEASQSLFMARDRLGVKPLFYAQRGSAFIFGSEPKALLRNPLVQPEVDAEGLAEVFVMGPSRTPGHGVYRGVSELKPGHALRHDATGTRVTQYWRLECRPHEHDFDTSVATIRGLLEDTVERQLVSDVPVCTLLSGGIDSSAVTAFAAMSFRHAGLDALHTYSVDYVDNDRHFRSDAFQPDADGPWARLVSEQFGTRHHVVMVDTGELAKCLTRAVHARDLPGYADIDTSLYLLCREVKKGATVALSGECADEIFGGYPWFRREDDLRAGTFPWMRKLQQRTRLYSPALLDYVRPEAYLERRYREALDEVPRLPGEDPHAARMREVLYLTLTRFMAALLDRKDRMSMAVGLEVRVPYCDHRLVEYVWNIPWAMKDCDQRGKGILRRALVGVLPQDVLARRKSPYPKTHDPSYLARVRSRVLDILDDPASPLLPLVDAEAVRHFANSDAGTFNLPWYGQLMTGPQLLAYLIQVDTWLRDYRVMIR
ncbi:MAG: asparagine synthase (glutamine-hydrolyzing) [Firmicutes bacterium]|nr:asparagine synthase (glutamine-hydrolyzing) [Bacillota bacterium]